MQVLVTLVFIFLYFYTSMKLVDYLNDKDIHKGKATLVLLGYAFLFMLCAKNILDIIC